MQTIFVEGQLGACVRSDGAIMRVGDVVFVRAYCGAVFGRPVTLISIVAVSHRNACHPMIWATVEDAKGGRHVAMHMDGLGLMHDDSYAFGKGASR